MKRRELFAGLFASDLRFGCRAIAGRLLLACGVSVLLCLLLYLQSTSSPQTLVLGFADYYMALFGGMSEYAPRQDVPFRLPAGWLCICALAAYTVLDYPVRDLNGMGTQTLVASGSRWCWWLSKCSWIGTCVLLIPAILASPCIIQTALPLVIPPLFSFIATMAQLLIAVCAGGWLFLRKDVLGRESDAP